MHELSLANAICDIVEREVRRDRPARALGSVTLVVVDVGRDANVEPGSLQFCLDALLSTPPFGRGTSRLEFVEGDDLRVNWFEIDEPSGAEPAPSAIDHSAEPLSVECAS
jgi:Hydrogenase/urease nickel incorporation, metallochaperone, hypA